MPRACYEGWRQCLPVVESSEELLQAVLQRFGQGRHRTHPRQRCFWFLHTQPNTVYLLGYILRDVLLASFVSCVIVWDPSWKPSHLAYWMPRLCGIALLLLGCKYELYVTILNTGAHLQHSIICVFKYIWTQGRETNISAQF